MIERLAEAIWNYESLKVREITQEFYSSNYNFSFYPEPNVNMIDNNIYKLSSGILELLCWRKSITPPDWVMCYQPFASPFFVIKDSRFHKMCLEQTPEMLIVKNIFCLENFLTIA